MGEHQAKWLAQWSDRATQSPEILRQTRHAQHAWTSSVGSMPCRRAESWAFARRRNGWPPNGDMVTPPAFGQRVQQRGVDARRDALRRAVADRLAAALAQLLHVVAAFGLVGPAPDVLLSDLLALDRFHDSPRSLPRHTRTTKCPSGEGTLERIPHYGDENADTSTPGSGKARRRSADRSQITLSTSPDHDRHGEKYLIIRTSQNPDEVSVVSYRRPHA